MPKADACRCHGGGGGDGPHSVRSCQRRHPLDWFHPRNAVLRLSLQRVLRRSDAQRQAAAALRTRSKARSGPPLALLLLRRRTGPSGQPKHLRARFDAATVTTSLRCNRAFPVSEEGSTATGTAQSTSSPSSSCSSCCRRRPRRPPPPPPPPSPSSAPPPPYSSSSSPSCAATTGGDTVTWRAPAAPQQRGSEPTATNQPRLLVPRRERERARGCWTMHGVGPHLGPHGAGQPPRHLVHVALREAHGQAGHLRACCKWRRQGL